MTFWQYWSDNKTKILGSLTTVIAALLSMIALGMFNADATNPALLEPQTVRWMTVVLSILNVSLGGGTIAAGVSNTMKIRVAEAEKEVAAALKTATEATPGGKV